MVVVGKTSFWMVIGPEEVRLSTVERCLANTFVPRCSTQEAPAYVGAQETVSSPA